MCSQKSDLKHIIFPFSNLWRKQIHLISSKFKIKVCIAVLSATKSPWKWNSSHVNFVLIVQIKGNKITLLFYKIVCREKWKWNYKIIAMQKLASMKVYSIKSNCFLQVHSRIIRRVHLNLITGKKRSTGSIKRKIEKSWTWKIIMLQIEL